MKKTTKPLKSCQRETSKEYTHIEQIQDSQNTTRNWTIKKIPTTIEFVIDIFLKNIK